MSDDLINISGLENYKVHPLMSDVTETNESDENRFAHLTKLLYIGCLSCGVLILVWVPINELWLLWCLYPFLIII